MGLEVWTVARTGGALCNVHATGAPAPWMEFNVRPLAQVEVAMGSQPPTWGTGTVFIANFVLGT